MSSQAAIVGIGATPFSKGTDASVLDLALQAITAQDSYARVLICGSLYLAGNILRENG